MATLEDARMPRLRDKQLAQAIKATEKPKKAKARKKK